MSCRRIAGEYPEVLRECLLDKRIWDFIKFKSFYIVSRACRNLPFATIRCQDSIERSHTAGDDHLCQSRPIAARADSHFSVVCEIHCLAFSSRFVCLEIGKSEDARIVKMHPLQRHEGREHVIGELLCTGDYGRLG